MKNLFRRFACISPQAMAFLKMLLNTRASFLNSRARSYYPESSA